MEESVGGAASASTDRSVLREELGDISSPSISKNLSIVNTGASEMCNYNFYINKDIYTQ